MILINSHKQVQDQILESLLRLLATGTEKGDISVRDAIKLSAAIERYSKKMGNRNMQLILSNDEEIASE